MSRELLAEAVQEEHIALKVCDCHPKPVYYDTEVCPACAMLLELGYWKRKGCKESAVLRVVESR